MLLLPPNIVRYKEQLQFSSPLEFYIFLLRGEVLKLHAKMYLPNITNKLHFAPLYYKRRQRLLQNSRVILLQNRPVLLQKTTIITESDSFITNCGSHCKIRRSLQNASVQKY